ncbi:MAG TPA: hypothetical protein VNT52_12385 [Acidimicrobiales bacterium]|jgi:hypothetical protein|nr:hypothetical protein [Acidimicrobiales bacterium]
MKSTTEEVLIELDERRRVYLSKVGRATDKRYLVRTEPDGTMIFTPASVVPSNVLRLLERPDIVAAIRHGQAHPEEAVSLTLPDGPDLDWENAD